MRNSTNINSRLDSNNSRDGQFSIKRSQNMHTINQLPMSLMNNPHWVRRPKTNENQRDPLQKMQKQFVIPNFIMSEKSIRNVQKIQTSNRNRVNSTQMRLEKPFLENLKNFDTCRYEADGSLVNSIEFHRGTQPFSNRSKDFTTFSNRSTIFEATTLDHTKNILISKMLKHKKGAYYDQSRFQTEDEEFPLYGPESSGMSDMRSLMSRNIDLKSSTQKRKNNRLNQSIDIGSLKQNSIIGDVSLNATFDIKKIEDYNNCEPKFVSILSSNNQTNPKAKSQFRQRLEAIRNQSKLKQIELEKSRNPKCSMFHSQRHQRHCVENWKPNFECVEKQTQLKKQKFKNAMAKIKLIRILSLVRKDKSMYLEALKTLEHDEYLNQVLQNDEIFAEQLINVMPETRYYINKLLQNIDSKYKIKSKVGFGIDTNQANLMKIFRTQMNKTVNIQQEQVSNFKRLGTMEKNLYNDFSKKKQGKNLEVQKKRVEYDPLADSSDFDEIKISAKVQRVRKLIQKHFLTGYPHSLKRKNRTGYNFNFGMIEKLGMFKRAFDSNFEGGVTIGQKYMELRMNLFSYSYVEKVMSLDVDELRKNKTKTFDTNHDLQEKNFNYSNAEILFNRDTMRSNFYKQIRTPNPVICCETKLAIQQFFEKTQQEGEIVKPTFLQIQKNQVTMYEETISEVQAKILKTYFIKTKNQPSKKISTLLVDSCYTSDKNFATILEGVQSQVDMSYKTILNKFVFTNGKLGPLSVKVLDNLMGSMKEIIINNIQTSMNKQVARDIINSMISNGRSLRKIRLSNMNLNDDKVIDGLIEVMLLFGANIQSINLSNTHLSPRLLAKFSEKLMSEAEVLKQLDLSYNILHFDDGEPEKKHSDQFVKNMVAFFSESDMLNHVNFSGMNFNKSNLLRVCEVLSCCPNLMAIHLNDNHISYKSNMEFFTEVISIFDIHDNHELTRQQKATHDCDNIDKIHELIISQQEKVKEKEEAIQQNTSKRQKKSMKGMMIKLKMVKNMKDEINHEVLDNLEKQQEQQQKAEEDYNKDLLDKEKMNGREWLAAVDGRNQKMLKCIEDTEKKYKIDVQGMGNDKVDQAKSRKNYKNHLLMSKQSKLIQNNKLLNHSKRGGGIGRNDDSQLDYFVVTRKCNNPELIWNQNSNNDHLPDKKYFDNNACKQWELSQKNECFICDGHKYTIIFFKSGLYTQQNQGLYEVRDEEMLEFLRNNYQYNQAKGDIYTPIICGSVVNGVGNNFPFKRMNFERKLRLMRVELFSVLLISQTQAFVKIIQDANLIMDGIVEYSKQDKNDQLQALQIHDKISDWTEIIYDKCLLNELTDVHVENASNHDFDVNFQKQNNKDMYVYANYLQPGIHKFLIYCPVNKRAFVKTILVDVNTADFYPEYPVKIKEPRKKLILNVWRLAIKETKEHLMSMCTNDTEHPGFNLSLVIRDPEELERVNNVVKLNYNQFRTYFMQFQLLSENYPKIDYNTALTLNLENIDKENDKKQLIPLSNEQLEIQFIRTVRNQEVNGIKGQMNRSEFVEFIIRLAISAFPKMAASLSLQIIIGSFLQPVFIKSVYLMERKMIQDCRPLNKLLYENRNFLRYLFDKRKEYWPGVSRGECCELIEELFHDDRLTMAEMQKHFLYSMENILDENQRRNKYWFLEFYEFQELLTRCAIQAFPDVSRGLEYKFFKILELLYANEGITSKDRADQLSPDVDITLVPIDENEEC